MLVNITIIHVSTTYKTLIFVITAVKTSNRTVLCVLYIRVYMPVGNLVQTCTCRRNRIGNISFHSTKIKTDVLGYIGTLLILYKKFPGLHFDSPYVNR
jgi:hypothetical protein